jgi:hypothetical protein
MHVTGNSPDAGLTASSRIRPHRPETGTRIAPTVGRQPRNAVHRPTVYHVCSSASAEAMASISAQALPTIGPRISMAPHRIASYQHHDQAQSQPAHRDRYATTAPARHARPRPARRICLAGRGCAVGGSDRARAGERASGRLRCAAMRCGCWLAGWLDGRFARRGSVADWVSMMWGGWRGAGLVLGWGVDGGGMVERKAKTAAVGGSVAWWLWSLLLYRGWLSTRRGFGV